jgi:DNA-binding MarR family transcriptional regulator
MGRHVLARRPDIDTAFPGWRARWMRVLSLVPPEGATLTALAGILDMAKQSAAEVVSELVEAGLVASEPHPDDRRAVVLRRTAAGRRLAAEVNQAVLDMQGEWAAQVDPRRFATFLAVVDELGHPVT